MKREKVEGSKQKAVGRNWEERLLRSVVLGFPAMPFDVRKGSALPSPVIENFSGDGLRLSLEPSPERFLKPFRKGKAFPHGTRQSRKRRLYST